MSHSGVATRKPTVGIVGLGVMGMNHARVLSEMGALKAVCDTRPQALASLSRGGSIARFRTFERFLREAEVDAVVVATPTSTHMSLTEELLEANLDVLVEKPLATNVPEGRAMVRRAQGKRAILGVGHVERYNPIVGAIRKRLTGDGPASLIYSRRMGPFPPRIMDVGVTLDLATHEIDAHLAIMGRAPTRLFAQAQGRSGGPRFPEHAVTIVTKYEGGLSGTIHANWFSPTKVRELEIWTDRQMIHADYLSQTIRSAHRLESPIAGKRGPRRTYAERTVRLPWREPLRRELEDFIRACHDRRAMQSSGETGLQTLAIAKSALSSVEDGRAKRLFPARS